MPMHESYRNGRDRTPSGIHPDPSRWAEGYANGARPYSGKAAGGAEGPAGGDGGGPRYALDEAAAILAASRRHGGQARPDRADDRGHDQAGRGGDNPGRRYLKAAVRHTLNGNLPLLAAMMMFVVILP